MLMQGILEGETNEVPFPFIADVRNIAHAHIQAAVTPEAKGQRYLVSNADTVPGSAIIAVLKERFPGLQFKDAKHEDRKPVLDNSKVSYMSAAYVCNNSRSSYVYAGNRQHSCSLALQVSSQHFATSVQHFDSMFRANSPTGIIDTLCVIAGPEGAWCQHYSVQGHHH